MIRGGAVVLILVLYGSREGRESLEWGMLMYTVKTR